MKYFASCSFGKDSIATVLLAIEHNEPLDGILFNECARLQTIPDWYKWKCSNAQQYKMLGNGWTVDVIKYILSFLPDELLYPDDYTEAMQEPEAADEPQKKCGNCVLCIHTHLGGECQLTDNPVEYEQDGCIDHIAED